MQGGKLLSQKKKSNIIAQYPPFGARIYINNSLQLARKYARIFVLEQYLFLKSHSFP